MWAAAAANRRRREEEEEANRRDAKEAELKVVKAGRRVKTNDGKIGKVLEVKGENVYVELEKFDYTEHQIKFHHYYFRNLAVV